MGPAGAGARGGEGIWREARGRAAAEARRMQRIGLEERLVSRHTFTSESVTEGHPDKMADQISDSVLDAVLGEDPYGRVACDTLGSTGVCVVAGEISTKGHIDF